MAENDAKQSSTSDSGGKSDAPKTSEPKAHGESFKQRGVEKKG